MIEVFNDDSIECLVKSIPVKDLKEGLGKDTLYYKMECNKDIEKEYELDGYPSLLVFKNSKLFIVKGYYSQDTKVEFFQRNIKKIIKEK